MRIRMEHLRPLARALTGKKSKRKLELVESILAGLPADTEIARRVAQELAARVFENPDCISEKEAVRRSDFEGDLRYPWARYWSPEDSPLSRIFSRE